MAVAGLKHQQMKFTLQSRHVLTADETDLYELAFLAGITLDPNVFKIILDLLKLNVAPMAIMQMLKSLRNRKLRKGPSSVLSTSSNDSNSSKPHSSRSEPGAQLQAPAAQPSRSRPSSTRPDRPPSRSRQQKNDLPS